MTVESPAHSQTRTGVVSSGRMHALLMYHCKQDNLKTRDSIVQLTKQVLSRKRIRVQSCTECLQKLFKKTWWFKTGPVSAISIYLFHCVLFVVATKPDLGGINSVNGCRAALDMFFYIK